MRQHDQHSLPKIRAHQRYRGRPASEQATGTHASRISRRHRSSQALRPARSELPAWRWATVGDAGAIGRRNVAKVVRAHRWQWCRSCACAPRRAASRSLVRGALSLRCVGGRYQIICIIVLDRPRDSRSGESPEPERTQEFFQDLESWEPSLSQSLTDSPAGKQKFGISGAE